MSIRDRYMNIYNQEAALSGAQGGLQLGGCMVGAGRKGSKCKPGNMVRAPVKKRNVLRCRGKNAYGGEMPVPELYLGGQALTDQFFDGAGRKKRVVKRRVQKAKGGQALSNEFFDGAGRKKESRWIKHVKAYAKKHNITYGEALRSKNISVGYVYAKK